MHVHSTSGTQLLNHTTEVFSGLCQEGEKLELFPHFIQVCLQMNLQVLTILLKNN